MRIFLLVLVMFGAVATEEPSTASVTSIVADPRQALVKIFTVAARPDYDQPWAMQRPTQGTGSGAWIGDGLILTNAHVVADATFVQIRRHGRPERHRVRIHAVDHGADVALLAIDDEAIFAGVPPLTFGELPEAQAELTVLGFPTGGDTLSTTRGVLSRVEHRRYAHSGFWLLAAQLDAAINPGNSGGPVLHQGQIVGIVMQGMTGADNIGYMVPMPVLRHVLDDLADGQLDGWPGIDVNVQGLESPALRSWLQLPAERSGQRVLRIHPSSCARDILQVDDVILAIDGLDIADDGTVELRSGERTNWVWAVQRHQLGSEVPFDIWRDGAPLTVTVPLSKRFQDNQLVSLERYDTRPSFFAYGGLIFTGLTRNYLMTWGREWWQRAPRSLLGYLDGMPEAGSPEQIVVLMRVLPHEVNRGWHGVRDVVIQQVDGVEVRSLAHLVELLETGQEAFAVLTLPEGGVIVIERAAATAAAAEIAATYRLPADRSEDLPQKTAAPLP